MNICWRMLLVAGSIVAAQSGCVRLGFEAGQSSRDSGSFDLPRMDLSTEASVEGPPPVDAPADLPVAPDQMPQKSGIYQPCNISLDCVPGLVCIIGAHGVCMKACTDAASCKVGESCYAITGVNLCVPQCKGDADCPKTMICLGDGPYPKDHCAPLKQAGGVGAKCCCGVLDACKAGHRCLGLGGQQHYCYEVCPNGSSCANGQICTKRMNIDFCLDTCNPLGVTACASHEICLPEMSKKAYCYPAQGVTGSCGGSTPCVTGMVCINNTCRTLCDPVTTPCSVHTCIKLNTGWSACLPTA